MRMHPRSMDEVERTVQKEEDEEEEEEEEEEAYWVKIMTMS